MGRWVVCERVCMAGLQAAQGGARDSPATALAPGLATVYCGLWCAACGVCSVLSESMCGPSRAFERWPCGACEVRWCKLLGCCEGRQRPEGTENDRTDKPYGLSTKHNPRALRAAALG